MTGLFYACLDAIRSFMADGWVKAEQTSIEFLSERSFMINEYKKPLFRWNRPIITCEKGATVCLIYFIVLYQTSMMIGKIIGLRRVCSYKKRPKASFTLVLSDAHSFTFSLISF